MAPLKLFYSIIKHSSYSIFITLFYLVSTLAGELHNKAPIEILSDTLVIDQDKNIAIFQGNVQATQGTLHLTSDKMIAYYISNNASTDKTKQVISSISTIGNVMIIDNNQKARGDTGEYNALKETLELKGSVILTKDGNILKGKRLIYNIKTGQSQIFGDNANNDNNRVKAILIPKTK